MGKKRKKEWEKGRIRKGEGRCGRRERIEEGKEQR